jgi:hypothetical protein
MEMNCELLSTLVIGATVAVLFAAIWFAVVGRE